jgi:hypothetical protein
MLAAQAQLEDLSIVSDDRVFDAYAVSRIWMLTQELSENQCACSEICGVRQLLGQQREVFFARWQHRHL